MTQMHRLIPFFARIFPLLINNYIQSLLTMIKTLLGCQSMTPLSWKNTYEDTKGNYGERGCAAAV